MISDPESLIGRQYTCQFRVIAVEPRSARKADGDRMVAVYMYGDKYTISLAELSTLVETGFVVEIPEGSS